MGEAGGERWGEGARVDDLVLGPVLGKGGMGVVWSARHVTSGAVVAVKALRLDAEPELVERFRREGEAQAKVDDHPHVVRVRSAGVALGHAYFVLEHAPGGDLDQRLHAQGPMRWPDAVRLVAALARGAAHCHARGVLHRDITPRNVLFAADGRPMLVDFGLARLAWREPLTRTGVLLGTPGYMAPEQAQGSAVDVRTDVHGLGLLLYVCLTSRLPWPGVTDQELLVAPLRDDPLPPPSTYRPLPPELDRVVLGALARAPADRPQTAADLAAALEACLRAGRRPPRRSRRQRWLALAAAFAAALLAATGGVALVGRLAPGLPAPASPAGGAAPLATSAVAVVASVAPTARPELLPPGLQPTGVPGRARNGRDGSLLVWIPEGSFVQGYKHALRSFSDCPEREVRLSGYWISVHEVTRRQWRAFCEATGRSAPPAPASLAGLADQDDHPAVSVSWEAARAYCAWAGLRLPTEAEWERAARGLDGRLYPWGDEPPTTERVNFRPTPLRRTTAAGSYPAGASPAGCLDMAGNAWEWVEDVYDAFYYRAGAAQDPCNRGEGRHILRGGSFQCRADLLPSPLRWEVDFAEDDTTGFRPARSGPGPR